ncbi:MAG: hypothetical protein AB1698_22375, partial [Pseudomonadota bacterium]
VQMVAGSIKYVQAGDGYTTVSMEIRVYPAGLVPVLAAITTVAGATLSGTAPAGATVEIVVGTTTLSVVASGAGTWSAEVPALAGDYDAQVRAVVGGSARPWSVPRRVTIGMQAATSSLLARMTVAPSAGRAGAINSLMVQLSAAGVLAKLDLLYILAAHDAQAARLNWASAAYDLAVAGAPTFVVDRGYAGAANAWLASGYNPATNGVRYTRNSAHVGAWDLTNRAGANVIPAGVSSNTSLQCAVMPRTTGDLAWINVNDQGAALGAVTRSDGLTLGSRLDAATRSNYRDATLLGTASAASISVPSVPLDLLCWSISGGTSRIYWCTDRIAVFTMGAGLTSTEVAAYHGALRTYLQTVGAVA